MTLIQVELPDATATAAREAGLLTTAALEDLLNEALRRQAGRRLLDVAKQIHAAGVEEMSLDEIDAEVHDMRAERRQRGGAGSSDDANRP